MAYDDVVSNIGGFGLYQKRILFLLCLPIIYVGFYLEPEYDASNSWRHYQIYYIAGILLGGLIFGLMSDKLGRRPTYFASLMSLLIYCVAEFFLHDFVSCEIKDLLIGTIATGVFLLSFVLAIEMVDRAHRKYAAILVLLFYTTITYRQILKGIKDQYPWIYFVLIGFGLLFLAYFWLIPESGMWLYIKGRKQSVVESSLNVARNNNVEITTQALYTLLNLQVIKEFKGSSSTWDRLRSPNLLSTSLLITLVWFANSLVYQMFWFGLTFITGYIGFSPMLLIGLIVIYVVPLLTIDWLGRRLLISGSMILGGISMFVCFSLHLDINWVSDVYVYVATFAFALSFVTLHIFAAEQLPTVVRTLGLGVFCTVGAAAEYISFYYFKDSYVGPILITFGLLSLLLRETRAKPMPETFEDTKISTRIQETSANV